MRPAASEDDERRYFCPGHQQAWGRFPGTALAFAPYTSDFLCPWGVFIWVLELFGDHSGLKLESWLGSSSVASNFWLPKLSVAHG